MSSKQIHKTFNASLRRVEKDGTEGIILVLDHEVSGNKHTTYVTQRIHLSLCDMRTMGGRFHEIMDHLLAQWREAKAKISGCS